MLAQETATSGSMPGPRPTTAMAKVTMRCATPERRFVTAYANANRAAGVEAVKAGRAGEERDGRIAVPVTVRTDIFKTLRGTMPIPVSGTGDDAGVDWDFSLRLPGLPALCAGHCQR